MTKLIGETQKTLELSDIFRLWKVRKEANLAGSGRMPFEPMTKPANLIDLPTRNFSRDSLMPA